MDEPRGNAASEPGASFGVRLRRARDAASLTQEDLAARAGLTPNAVSALERGEHRHPYPATVRALAAALGLAAEEGAALAASVPKRGQAAQPDAALPGLPAPLSPLVGREREVAAVSALLRRDGVRLVTLTGPGGVGKTRLALQVATDLGGDFAHGAKFVALAAVRDPALVASTIAHTLGVVEAGGRSSVDRLGDALRKRHLLLVLDNYEHLLDAAPLITDLLTRCPTLAVLATSRSPLRLAGEQGMPVPPLAVPDLERLPVVERLAEVGAVRLFVDRARAVDPAFALTDENAGAVAAVCHRLDGLPLAIELAAARSTLFTPAAMLPRLAQRLPLLTGGRRDAPARHRTMRDAIAWSHDLLRDEEQTLFRRLAVFAGGFTLEAAEAMAAAAGDRAVDAFAAVAALVDHSLLRVEPGSSAEPRYLMLETIREFGLERLAESGKGERTRDAHAAYFAALDGRLEPNRLAPQERFDDRLLRIEADHPNCRAALAHLAATGDAAGVLRLAGALAVFWHHRGHLREGRRWLEWALERTADAAPLWRGRALAGLSLILWSQGDPERAALSAEAARAIADAIDDKELLALAVHMLGLVEVVRGHWDQAERLMTEALGVQREIGTPGYGAMALTTLSEIAHRRGDVETSVRRAEEALALFRAVDHASGAAMALCTLAGPAAARGDDWGALSAYQEALRLWAGIGERWAIAWAFSGLAALAAARGQPERAATLVGAVDARLDESGADLWLSDRRLYERAAATARAALGEERFAALRETGRALPFAAAVAAGAAVAIPDLPGRPSTSAPASPGAATLTASEQDVLRLLVERRSKTRATWPDRHKE
jgi:predicted ATPase/DNA-binding XRE family transcriptional regulator